MISQTRMNGNTRFLGDGNHDLLRLQRSQSLDHFQQKLQVHTSPHMFAFPLNRILLIVQGFVIQSQLQEKRLDRTMLVLILEQELTVFVVDEQIRFLPRHRTVDHAHPLNDSLDGLQRRKVGGSVVCSELRLFVQEQLAMLNHSDCDVLNEIEPQLIAVVVPHFEGESGDLLLLGELQTGHLRIELLHRFQRSQQVLHVDVQ
mmetsp:Transcript_11617/g.18740  ORF Transcript_11617/g.18740 Transcript_11617/m.18740 type:complete len:202 (-) Transcript_11617:252-857(-)